MSRKKRETLSPEHSNVGPFWLVRSMRGDHYVAARTAEEAIEVFYSIPTIFDLRQTSAGGAAEVTAVERITTTVYARPDLRPGKADGS